MTRSAPHVGQENVNAHFESHAAEWRDLYTATDVTAERFRYRQRVLLDWLSGIPSTPNPRALDVGCGAGYLSVELALRGWSVHAVDPVPGMLEITRRHAAAAGVDERVTLQLGDVHRLPFDDESFDVVVANGVLPWVSQPEAALREMARVTRAGGYVAVTANNRAALMYLLDPVTTPLLQPLRRRVRSWLTTRGIPVPGAAVASAAFHSRRFIDQAVAAAGLLKGQSLTYGFGPFKFLGREVLPESIGLRLQRWLHGCAERGTPLVRSTGIGYAVLAAKPASDTALTAGPLAGSARPERPHATSTQ